MNVLRPQKQAVNILIGDFPNADHASKQPGS
jgi:hypothetical protein